MLACDFESGSSSTVRGGGAGEAPPRAVDGGAGSTDDGARGDAGVLGPVRPDAGSGRDDPPAGGSPYPAGPYGTSEGATMPNLWFTTRDGGEQDWEDVRADGSVKVIVWGSGAGWCGPCRAEAAKMTDLHDRYASRGLYVIESLFEDEARRMATPEYVRQWEAELGTTHVVVAEPNPPYGEASAIPMLWVIDAGTMRIVAFGNGLELGMESTILSALERASR